MLNDGIGGTKLRVKYNWTPLYWIKLKTMRHYSKFFVNLPGLKNLFKREDVVG